MSTTTTILTPVLVSHPYAASRSSTAWRRPTSPESPVPVDPGAAGAAAAPPPEELLLPWRSSKISRVEERRRENCSGVRIGAKVFVEGLWEGKIWMWRGLFWSFGLLR